MSIYLIKPVPSFPNDIHRHISASWSPTKMLAFAAFMAAFAAIFQSAGGLLPGIGFFISPLSTAPILFAMLISYRSGVFAYLITIGLLLLIQPAELFIFPFTTGFLGLSLGWSFRFLTTSLAIFFTNGIALLLGICVPLYILGFPVFGPDSFSSITLTALLILFGFSLLYSWIWLEFGMFLLRKLSKLL